MLAPCHNRSEDPSLFLAKYAFHWFEHTKISSPYLFQTDLIFPNVSDYLRWITAACWRALILPFLGQKEQTNHSTISDSFVTLPGHSFTATGNEASCPRVSPALLVSVDEIDQSMPNCPEVSITSFTFYYYRNTTSEYQWWLRHLMPGSNFRSTYLICVPMSVAGIIKKKPASRLETLFLSNPFYTTWFLH